MNKIIKHIRRWNVWRKNNLNSKRYKILVLLGIIKSPSFYHVWLPEECEAFQKGFYEGLYGAHPTEEGSECE